MTAIGKMRERVTIQSHTRVDDGGGGDAGTWADVATVWAQVTALTGRERLLGEGREENISHRVTMRHRSDVSGENRLVWGAKNLQIIAVLPDEKSTRLVVECVEGMGT